MTNELALEGNRYKARFSANLRMRVHESHHHYSSNVSEYYWWSGTGRFLLKTNESGRKKSLENCIFSFCKSGQYGSYRIKRPFIVDYNRLVDLELSLMYKNAEKRTREIIPEIYPVRLGYEKLLDQGIIADDSGQTRLALEKQEVKHNGRLL